MIDRAARVAVRLVLGFAIVYFGAHVAIATGSLFLAFAVGILVMVLVSVVEALVD